MGEIAGNADDAIRAQQVYSMYQKKDEVKDDEIDAIVGGINVNKAKPTKEDGQIDDESSNAIASAFLLLDLLSFAFNSLLSKIVSSSFLSFVAIFVSFCSCSFVFGLMAPM